MQVLQMLPVEVILYNAVYNGNSSLLKYIICPMTRSEIKRVTSIKLDRTTLLLIASRYGHHQVMKFLIEFCEVDIEEVGEVEFDGELVLAAPPLWCAAAAGHLDCVKLLLEHGANVNCTTHTNSTPLRAACFDGHYEVVKVLVENGADIEIANELGHTCLMISCYKRHYRIAAFLIENGCQINRQGVKGNTALHDCAESNSMDILKLLVKNGATLKRDCFGLTPLFTASLNGNIETFNYLKSVYKCTPEEEADAYKLLGAAFVDKFNNLTEAMKIWKCAARLSSKCSLKYLNSLLICDQTYLRAYDHNVEFRNETDLEILLYDPELMKIQAMIIRERILGLHHRETYYFIRYHGASYVESRNYTRCLQLWMYNLERQASSSMILSEITQNSFISMVDLFTVLSHFKESELKIADVQSVLQMAMDQVLGSVSNFAPRGCMENSRVYRILDKFLVREEVHSMFNDSLDKLDRQFVIILHLIGTLCHYQGKMTYAEQCDFKNLIIEFLSHDPRSSRSHTILHVICILSARKGTLSLNEVSLFDVFKFLVDISVDVNVRDAVGNTPLHFLMEHVNVNMKLVDYMIESGGHVDLQNVNGVTPIDHLKKKPKWQDWNTFKIKYVSLQCLCAQIILKNRICKKRLPNNLRRFVEEHRKKETPWS